jgi:hypothetical protein
MREHGTLAYSIFRCGKFYYHNPIMINFMLTLIQNDSFQNTFSYYFRVDSS